jgi:hypothetical protein
MIYKNSLLILFILLILALSCKQEPRKVNEVVTLKKYEQYTIPIDSSTLPQTKALFSFVENSKNFIGYLNKNEILIFNLENRRLTKRILLEKEGVNGLGIVRGFWYLNKDSIFITSSGNKNIFLINDSGEVINKYAYAKTYNNETTGVTFYSRSNINTPLIKIGSKLYLTNYVLGNYNTLSQDDLSAYPVCVELNIETGESQFLPMKFPDDLWIKGKQEPSFARIFNGQEFIDSWRYYDKILVTRNHKDVSKKTVKSSSFDRLKPKPSFIDLFEYVKYLVESPAYLNIIYDEFNDLYYMFFYPGIEIEAGQDVMKLWDNLPVFSVIILNSQFEKVGEVEMPRNTYFIENYFVTEKGLHLSRNHPLNRDFDENFLSFDVFKPEKGEN